MANVFVISDTHFGHSNIIRYAGRPFANADEMDEALIEKWNAVVSPGDKVYHLGDVAIARRKLELLGRLNGRKVLIRGNHDVYKLADYAEWFSDVRGSHELSGFILTHIPVHPSQKYRFDGNVHGHLHEKQLEDPWYFNVSVEQVDYTPLPLEAVVARYARVNTGSAD